MGAGLVQNPLYHCVLGLLCGFVGFRLGWRTGQRIALPTVQGLLGFLAFAASWRAGGPFFGTLAVGGWAVGTSLISIPVFKSERQRIDEIVVRARAYRESMLAWLRSGRGPEAEPLATARAHLWELGLYLLAAVISANLLSLVLGAVLLNYMNAYVAALLLAARDRWRVRLLAWNSWILVRVAAYVLLGSACAAPLAGYLGHPAPGWQVRWLLAVGGMGVALDLVLKLLLSRSCGRLLAGALDLGPRQSE